MDFSLFEATPGISIALLPDTPKFTIVAVSNDFLTTSGLLREAIIGKGYFESFSQKPEDPGFPGLQNLQTSFEHIIIHKKSHQLSVHRYDIPGEKGIFLEKYRDVKNTPVLNDQGGLAYIIHTAEDIKAQVKSLQKKDLQKSESKYRTLFNSMDQGFCVLEMIFDANNQPIDYTFIEANPVFEKQTGLKDAIGKTARQLVPDLEAKWFNVYGDVALTGQAKRFTEGSKAMGRSFDVYAFKLGDTESRKVALLFTDITEQRKAEEIIRGSEERFRKLADESPMFVFIIEADPQGSVSYWNKTWLDYTGQSLEEAIGRSWNGIVHPDDVDIIMNIYLRAFQEHTFYFIPSVRIKRHDGEYRWHAFKGNPRYLPNGDFNGYSGVGFDIHDQKMAEEALKQSEAQLQQKVTERTRELETQKNLFDNILKNSSNGISVTEMIRDEEGEIIDARTIMANDAAVKYIGLPKDVFLSKTAIELDPNIMDSAYGQACLKTLETGEPALSQYFMELTGRWQELTISKMDDNRLIHIFTDVTPIKEAQIKLERTIEELKRSNDNLEEFAYAASHDLKEPIRKIRTFSDRMKYNLQGKLSEDDQHYFHRMEKATERMQHLIDDLLEYSHVSTSITYLDKIDLNVKIRQVLEDLELEIAVKHAKINVGLLPVIKGHKRQIQQLFHNLITNALKFNKPGIAPEISITSSLVSAENINTFQIAEEQKNDMYNMVTIIDNGIGFEQEHADHIFKMFQRLHGKTEYEGTGIGLAIVRKVIENHKGFIRAESRPGEGATFKIYFPV